MIRKVQQIKAFGVFSDFRWPSGLSDFNRYNLLYGWNYSGKTTLSRALRCLEHGKRHPDFEQAEVRIHTDDNKTYDLVALENPPAIRVFNSDFVKENLVFDTGNAAPILVLGEADIAKQALVVQKRVDREKLRTERDANQKAKTDTRESLDKALTNYARDVIKNPLGKPDYGRLKFEPKVAECAANPAQFLLGEDNFPATSAVYRSVDKKASLSPKVSAFSSLSGLHRQCESLLNRSIVGQPIPHLVNNAELESWVDKGRPLHKDRDTCQFCGQSLPANFLIHLSQHFTVEYDKLIADLAVMRTRLVEVKEESVEVDAETSFYPELAGRLRTALFNLGEAQKSRANAVDQLLQAVENKEQKPFTSLPCPAIDDGQQDVDDALSELNQVVDDHNTRTALFEAKKQEAFEKLERHYAASFAVEQDYIKKTELIETLGQEIEVQGTKLDELDREIRDLEKQISEASKGAERINELLGTYFRKEDLQIAVSPDKRFQTMRGKQIAKNLSEGEKTAIAFAYFVTRVQDGKVPLADTIVMVDDPVSSLDAGHLFNTYALIKTQLAGCRQLFVSTHSFEFYNLVREWAAEDEKPETMKRPQDQWKRWRIYLVKRVESESAQIEHIPKELLLFKSEYHYLFSTLYRFDASGGGDFNVLFGLPNIVRRFLEAFGGIMIPTSKGLHGKMDRLFADAVERERVWKFINHYSHNTSVTRSVTIPDTSECKAVVQSCLKAVKNWDAEYFNDIQAEVV